MKKCLKKRLFIALIFSIITINLLAQTFVEQTEISLPGVSNGSVAWGDYDNDGELDILIAGLDDGDKMIVKVFHNDGGNSFTDQINIFSTPPPSGYSCFRHWDTLSNIKGFF